MGEMEGLNYYEGDKKNVVIPEGTRAIVVQGFHDDWMRDDIPLDCTICFKEEDLWDVETVDMPDSVEIIGPKAFQPSNKLKTVNFSKNLKKICIHAFSGTSLLKTVSLPKSLKEIQTWAFVGCGLDDIFYDGTIFEFDKINTRGAFLNIRRLHCSDCTVDFSKKDYYIDELKYEGAMEDWNNNMSSHWLNKRSAKIKCTDGEIINQKLNGVL